MTAVGTTAGIALSEDHLALAATVRRWAAAHVPATVPRALLDADDEPLAPFWEDLSRRGWLGLHLPESVGGEGYGLAELVVVLEALGEVCAPGPFLPTAAAAAAIARFGPCELRASLLPDLAAGRAIGAVGLGGRPVPLRTDGPDTIVSGTWTEVLSGAQADVLVLPVEVPGAGAWVVLDAADLDVEASTSLDRTRRVARVTAHDVAVAPDRLLTCPPGSPDVDDLVVLMVAAESVGLAAWCVRTAAEHAVIREQFGRPIGQFQAIKHRVADMLGAVEQARAAVWDAGRSGDALAVAVAAALAPEAAHRGAKDCVQVLGGIGFTWDHDVHLYLKRALAGRALVGGPRRWQAEVARLALAGARRHTAVELPPGTEPHRDEVRAFLDDLLTHEKSTWNAHLADAGYLVPHWPRPWGRDASPVEQLVIDEELRRARVRRPHLAVGAWALPTLIAHGTEEQQRRWIPATLRGEVTWCQMFSEPGAGSDLASLATKAVRTDGGWLLTGQKVWTTLAHVADWGICLARTDPRAPRHEGIGCFLVDMRSEGIDVRPLRELTGAEMFNEVFLSDVFVPDECVVGAPTSGWAAARTTLANERVSMGSGSSMGPGVEALLDLAAPQAAEDATVAEALGQVVAIDQSLAAMGNRMTLRALAGSAAGPEASIRKLLGVEHDQRVQEMGLELLGPAAASGEGAAAGWIAGFLGNRSLSIAGGTSEIQRNVIAERLLGLPRDP